MELKSDDLFFYKKFWWEVKESEKWLEKKKMVKARARKELNVELFIAE